MDPLRREDIERGRARTLQESAKLAFEAFRTGVWLERAALRARHPEATEQELDDMIQRWLERVDE